MGCFSLQRWLRVLQDKCIKLLLSNREISCLEEKNDKGFTLTNKKQDYSQEFYESGS
jgi:hypothetical protein